MCACSSFFKHACRKCLSALIPAAPLPPPRLPVPRFPPPPLPGRPGGRGAPVASVLVFPHAPALSRPLLRRLPRSLPSPTASRRPGRLGVPVSAGPSLSLVFSAVPPALRSGVQEGWARLRVRGLPSSTRRLARHVLIPDEMWIPHGLHNNRHLTSPHGHNARHRHTRARKNKALNTKKAQLFLHKQNQSQPIFSHGHPDASGRGSCVAIFSQHKAEARYP